MVSHFEKLKQKFFPMTKFTALPLAGNGPSGGGLNGSPKSSSQIRTPGTLTKPQNIQADGLSANFNGSVYDQGSSDDSFAFLQKGFGGLSIGGDDGSRRNGANSAKSPQ